MGWLGWTERESKETDVNAIMIAMEGKIEMMYPDAVKKTKSGSISDQFKSMAKENNAKFK